MEDWSRAKLCDVMNLFLGTILFFSPWLFSLSAGAPRQTASIIGLFVAVLSIAALAAFAVWEEWLNLFAGLWLIVAPWLLGFQDSNAMTIDVVIGTVVAALAALEIWLAVDHRQGGPTDGGIGYAGLRCWTGRGVSRESKSTTNHCP
jgi:SPW repeat-containing protein